MYSRAILSGLLAALVSTAGAIDATRNPALNEQLEDAPTALDRLALLPNNAQWTYDFTVQPTYSFSPGSVVNANAATFPASVDQGLTMAMIQLGPCAILPPHFHPRGSNYVVAVAGNTTTYMIQENGARTVTAVLTPGKMTVFPSGSIHSMQNTGCTNAQLVSALSSTDTGTTNIANALFSLPQNIVNAAFGNPSGGMHAGSIPAIANGATAGDNECLLRCGLSTGNKTSLGR